MFVVDFYDLPILYSSRFNSTTTFIEVGHGPVARYSKPCMNGMPLKALY